MIKVNVEIDNKSWNKKIKDPKKYFLKKIKKIHFLNKKNITFTILLTNSFNMKKLNKKFRKINKATDVLSFPAFNLNNLKLIKKKNSYIGDMAVSYEIVDSRSKKNFFIKEFDKVWVHGFLHLMGYDHIKNKDYIKMHKVEKRILNLI